MTIVYQIACVCVCAHVHVFLKVFMVYVLAIHV